KASSLDNTVVLCISKDLPFAHSRFCAAEGLDNVVTLSDFKGGSFSEDYGVRFTDGPLEGLLSRSVVVIDPNGKVTYTEQVAETGGDRTLVAPIVALECVCWHVSVEIARRGRCSLTCPVCLSTGL